MNRLVIHGHVCSWSGWGRLVEFVGRAIEAEGVPVAVWPSLADDWFLPHTDWMEGHRIERPEPGEFVLSINPPWIEVKDRPFGVLTMWEVDGLPPRCPERLNRAEWVATPSDWGADVLRRNGVDAPIHVTPLATGNALVAPREGPRTPGPYVFGAAGRWESGGARKGLADVIAAFERAFPSDPDVRLRVKCFPDCQVPRTMDGRIEILRTPLDDAGMADWYRSLDAYVTASRGEGWGFQAFEAIASGVLVLAIRHGGSTAFLDGRNSIPLAYRMERAEGVYASSQAFWAVPDVDYLAARMKLVAGKGPISGSQRREVAASVERFDWTKTAGGLLALIR